MDVTRRICLTRVSEPQQRPRGSRLAQPARLAGPRHRARGSNTPKALQGLLSCALVAVLGLSACGGDKPKTQSGTPQQKDRTATAELPASKRLLGKWLLKLDEVPDSALTKEFRELKKSGKGDEMYIEYTFTESDFRLLKTGAGGLVKLRWHYQILNEVGDRLELQREDPDGSTKKIGITFTDADTMILGTGTGMVPLTRKR